MKTAILIFPKLTVLDFVGMYDPLGRLKTMGVDPEFSLEVIGTAPEVVDDRGLVVKPSAVLPDLQAYDLLLVPGGFGTRTLMHDEPFLDYLRTWGLEKPVASVCTGALLLAAAGLLGKGPATTNQHAFELLWSQGVDVLAERIVDTGRVITAAGVASSLDLGLYLVERYYGAEARGRIADQMEYRGYPTMGILARPGSGPR